MTTPSPNIDASAPTLTLAALNALPAPEAEARLTQCCGSRTWAAGVAARRPFASLEALYRAADAVWWKLAQANWIEAFRRETELGSRIPAARSDDIAARLNAALSTYQAKFAYPYVVFVTGQSAEAILAILEQRLRNDAPSELAIAAEQQRRILRARLEKFISGGPS
jgi:OHCU decarboxylase